MKKKEKSKESVEKKKNKFEVKKVRGGNGGRNERKGTKGSAATTYGGATRTYATCTSLLRVFSSVDSFLLSHVINAFPVKPSLSLFFFQWLTC